MKILGRVLLTGLITNSASAEVKLESKERCFSDSQGYYHQVFSEPFEKAKTDATLSIRYKGRVPSTYDAHQKVSMEVDNRKWKELVVATPVRSQWRTVTVKIPKEAINKSIEDLGWIRFMVHNPYVGITGNCTQLTLTYNEEKKETPKSTSFRQSSKKVCNVFFDHEYEYKNVPKASDDGAVSISYVGCGGASVGLEVKVNGNWEDLGTVSTSRSCKWTRESLPIPKAYINRGIRKTGNLQMRATVDDRCVAGMGCKNMSDPCFSTSISFER